MTNEGLNEKIEVIQDKYLLIGEECIDTGCLKGICDKNQITVIGLLIRWLVNRNISQYVDIQYMVEKAWMEMDQEGMDILFSTQLGNVSRFFALPRKYELMAAIDRFRHTVYEMVNGD